MPNPEWDNYSGEIKAGPFSYSPMKPRTNTDDAAMWLAIMDNPWDAAPRLVLSDWYEEHGQPETATGLRKWAGGWADLSKLKTTLGEKWPEGQENEFASYPRDGILGVHELPKPVRFRAHSVWVGEMTRFYQAIREGLFLRRPIQRVIFRDIGERFQYHPSGNDHAEFIVDPKDMEVEMMKSFSLQSAYWITSVRRVYTLGKLIESLSLAAVHLGRKASGLPDLGVMTDPEASSLLAIYTGFRGEPITGTRGELIGYVPDWSGGYGIRDVLGVSRPVDPDAAP